MAQLSARRTRRITTFRLHKPEWVDPYPSIPGTQPEKMIFEALVMRHIYFIFQGPLPELERGKYVTLDDPAFKPDFVLPEYRLIIDPFSPFHHSLPEGAERDARKRAIYRAFGYAFCHPWAVAPGVFVIDQPEYPHGEFRGALALLSAITELARGPRLKLKDPRDIKAKARIGYRLGPYLGAGATGVALANAARKKPHSLVLRRGRHARSRTRR